MRVAIYMAKLGAFPFFFVFCLLPSHIPGLGNSYFWRKRYIDRVGNAELTTRGSLGQKLATHPTGCPRGPL